MTAEESLFLEKLEDDEWFNGRKLPILNEKLASSTYAQLVTLLPEPWLMMEVNLDLSSLVFLSSDIYIKSL